MKDRITQLKLLLESDPNDSFLRFALAKELEQIGATDSSLDEYKQLIALDPDYIGTYYHYAQLLINRNKLAIAGQIIEQGIAVATNKGDHHAAGELRNLKGLWTQEVEEQE